MKRLFSIQSQSETQSDSLILLCELSHYHFCYAVAEPQTKSILYLNYYEPDGLITISQIKQALNEDNPDRKSLEKVVISSAFPNMAIVPDAIFKKEQPALFLNAEDNKINDKIFYDIIKEQHVVIVYSVPQVIMDGFDNASAIETINIYTPQLKLYNGFASADQISVDFTTKEFRVLLKKDQQLQFIQTYPYAAPLDVVYYLLAICTEHNLSQTETTITLSGLVNEDSALYKELYQYFSNIHFAKPGTSTLIESSYPQHFFSSMYNLAACVL